MCFRACLLVCVSVFERVCSTVSCRVHARKSVCVPLFGLCTSACMCVHCRENTCEVDKERDSARS